jgi:hypothetical protein
LHWPGCKSIHFPPDPTAPLPEARFSLIQIKSSIFFITTYFSDYILVPLRCRGQVTHALEERGFAFEQNTSTYINPSHHGRNHSSTSSFEAPLPSTPPPANISELQTRTFTTLKRRNIIPTVNPRIRLIRPHSSPRPVSH